MLLDIGEVARKSGLSPATLRFYEEKGLIAPVGRRGLRRLYEPVVLERLALVALGRAASFTLAEIGPMLGDDGAPALNRQMLVEKAEALDRAIARLTAMRDGLRHAAACPAPRHMECPTFRRILDAAAHGFFSRDKAETAPF